MTRTSEEAYARGRQFGRAIASDLHLGHSTLSIASTGTGVPADRFGDGRHKLEHPKGLAAVGVQQAAVDNCPAAADSFRRLCRRCGTRPAVIRGCCEPCMAHLDDLAADVMREEWDA